MLAEIYSRGSIRRLFTCDMDVIPPKGTIIRGVDEEYIVSSVVYNADDKHLSIFAKAKKIKRMAPLK